MKSPADSLIVQRLEVDPPVLSESGTLSQQHADSFVRDRKLNFTLTALIPTLGNCVHSFFLFCFWLLGLRTMCYTVTDYFRGRDQGAN